MSRPKIQQPQEDPSVVVARDRQVQELAELDEEENRRIKRAMSVRGGVRAFRRSSGGKTGNPSSSSSGGAPSGGRRATLPSNPSWGDLGL